MTLVAPVLPSITDETVDPVINLRGEDVIFKYAIDMIDHAEASVYVEIWNEDMSRVRDALDRATVRGVDVRIVGYNSLDYDGGVVYQHGHGTTIEDTLGGRWCIFWAEFVIEIGRNAGATLGNNALAGLGHGSDIAVIGSHFAKGDSGLRRSSFSKFVGDRFGFGEQGLDLFEGSFPAIHCRAEFGALTEKFSEFSSELVQAVCVGGFSRDQ